MTTSLQYLEAAKIEEVASQLRNEGYEVIISPGGTYEGYDLIATKGDEKLAVEVKVNSQLRDSAELIRYLQKRAVEHGIDEFRLVVVSPPREVSVEIEGLKKELLKYLRKRLAESDYEDLGIDSIDSVAEIEVDSIEVTIDGIHVVGNGVVKVHFYPLNVGDSDAKPLRWNLPLMFDLRLSHNLEILQVYRMSLDTSTPDE